MKYFLSIALALVVISCGGPAAPTSVAASDGASYTEITVTWAAIADVISYDVYRSTSLDGEYTNLGTVTTNTYTDTTNKKFSSYYYKMTAKHVSGVSGFSDADSGYTTFNTLTYSSKFSILNDGISLHVANSNVYVTIGSGGTNKVGIYSTAGALQSSWDCTTNPEGIHVTDTKAYVVDGNSPGKIISYNLDGSSATNFPGAYSNPKHLDIYNDVFYLATYDSNSIDSFSLDGTLLSSIDVTPKALTGVSVYNDEVYVTNENAKTVTVYPLTSSTVSRTWVAATSATRGLIATKGFVFVASEEKVFVFDTLGTTKTSIGAAATGAGNGEFDTAVDVDINQEGENTYLYVVDSENDRIQKFLFE